MSAHAEAAVALAYAAFLLAIAEGLAVLGRWTTSTAGTGRHGEAAWPRADVLRFHAALGASLVVLAAFVLAVALSRHADGTPAASLAFGLAAVAVFARRAVRRLRAPRHAPRPDGRRALDRETRGGRHSAPCRSTRSPSRTTDPSRTSGSIGPRS